MSADSTNSVPQSLDKRGILDQSSIAERFDLRRFPPAPNLADFVDSYWCTRWNLDGKPSTQQGVLAHPCVQCVIEDQRSGVFGVTTARFDRDLSGRGRAFGIKFWPGAFRCFVDFSIAKLTDQRFSLVACFGQAGVEYEEKVLATDEDRELKQLADEFLASWRPRLSTHGALARQCVEYVRCHLDVIKVDQLAAAMAINKRRLQRLFAEYVGVSPKWVIQRYRLHEAVERLESGERVDLTRLAMELNYFDQSHFAKDFERIVGRTPSDYRLGEGGRT